MNMIVNATAEGLLWGMMALGIFLSFRILRMPDMTAEGSFPLGAAVGVQLIVSGFHPLLATLAAFFVGCLAGAVTVFLMTKLRVPALLSGVLTMTGLYSINLRIMDRANLSLHGEERVTSLLGELFPLPTAFDTIFIGLIIYAVLVLFLLYFFQTDLGQALIATGDNERMARSLGIQTNTMKMIGLMLANGFIALSGSLIAQNNGYADVSMGIGTIVIGLASVIIAEVLFTKLSLGARLVSLALGAIIYRLIISSVLLLGMQPNDLKLLSAVMLALFLAFSAHFDQIQVQFNNFRSRYRMKGASRHEPKNSLKNK